MRLEFHILSWPLPEAFLDFTYATHRPVLSSPEAVPGWLPIGIYQGTEPCGLGLAQARAEDDATILSLFVQPALWGHGVGTRLLWELEQGLARWGCTRAGIQYSSQGASTAALERVLQKSGWPAPEPTVVVAELPPNMAETAPWVRRTPVPAAYTVFPWVELSVVERAALALLQSTIPSSLWPFTEEERLDPVTSLGLRRDGETVGWHVAHRTGPHSLRSSALYVRPEWRTPQATLGLLAEAMRRRDAHYGLTMVSTLAVELENAPMYRLFARKFRPHAQSWWEVRQAAKALV